MFHSLSRRAWATAFAAFLSSRAFAEDSSGQAVDPISWGFGAVLVACALMLAAYYAHVAFEAPIATPDDGPAPPRYMTQPRQYRMGMTAYIGLCLVAYALIVYNYKDLSPFL